MPERAFPIALISRPVTFYLETTRLAYVAPALYNISHRLDFGEEDAKGVRWWLKRRND